MRSSPAAVSIRRPNTWSISWPKASASSPRTAETVTWPKPHNAVTRTVFDSVQPRARATAANGTQWSGAIVWSAPIEIAARASRPASGSDMVCRLPGRLHLGRDSLALLVQQPVDPAIQPLPRARRQPDRSRHRHRLLDVANDALDV